MFYVYILQSLKDGRYYIGQTNDIQKRLVKHNNNEVRSTKNKGPWRVIKHEKFNSRAESLNREKQIKSYKGGEAFKKLLQV